MMHLAELCVEVLQQNEEHHAEVCHSQDFLFLIHSSSSPSFMISSLVTCRICSLSVVILAYCLIFPHFLSVQNQCRKPAVYTYLFCHMLFIRCEFVLPGSIVCGKLLLYGMPVTSIVWLLAYGYW